MLCSHLRERASEFNQFRKKYQKLFRFLNFLFFLTSSSLRQNHRCKFSWVTVLVETSKDLQIILITIVLSFTNSLSRTNLYFSLKTSFVYSNLFSFAKTVTIHCYIQTSKSVRSPSSVCKKTRAATSKLQSNSNSYEMRNYNSYEMENSLRLYCV